MMSILESLQNSGFAMSVKESEAAFTFLLCLHSMSLGFIVGISAMAALRVMGVASRLPMASMVGFFPPMWVGLWVSVLSGAVLTTLYPTSYLRDAAFYLKLGAVALAVANTRKLGKELVRGGESADAKIVAGTVLASWGVAVMAARIVAYDYQVGVQSVAAFLVFTVALFAVGYGARRFLGLGETSEQATRASVVTSTGSAKRSA